MQPASGAPRSRSWTPRTRLAYRLFSRGTWPLEDDDVNDIPTPRRRLALEIIVLLVLAAALLAWFTWMMT